MQITVSLKHAFRVQINKTVKSGVSDAKVEMYGSVKDFF